MSVHLFTKHIVRAFHVLRLVGFENTVENETHELSRGAVINVLTHSDMAVATGVGGYLRLGVKESSLRR